MNINKPTEKIKKSPKSYISLALVILGVVLGVLILPNIFQSKPKVDFSSIEKICKLATLKTYYHNVITETKPGNFITKILENKHYWIEYTGTIKSGVDANKIRIGDPDLNGIIKIYVPDAEVITVNVDINTISAPITEDKIFDDIKTEDRIHAFAEAQEALQREAEKDEFMLNKAKENAKNLIEQYIISIGKGVGRDLTVKWVSY